MNRSGGRPTPGGGGGPSAFSMNVPGLYSTVNTATDSMARVATGALTTKDAFDSLNGYLGSFGAASGTLSNAIKQTGNIVFDINQTMRETGQFGVTMAGELFKYNTEVTGAQLRMSEFSEIVSRNSKSMSGLGSTMDKSANAYLSLLTEIQKTDAVAHLKAMGMTAREVADITQVSMTRQRGMDLLTVEGQKSAAYAATNLAVELTKISQITGKSREEQLRASQELMDRAQIQAAIFRRGSDFGTNLGSVVDRISGKFGPSITRAFQEVATGGIRSKSATETMASIGDRGEVAAIMQQLGAAVQSGNKQLVSELTTKFEAKYAETLMSKQRMGAVEVLPEDYLKVGQLMMEGMHTLRPLQTEQQYDPQTGRMKYTTEEALARLSKETALTTTGQQETPTGLEKNTQALISRTINQIDQNVLKAASATVNKTMGDFGSKITSINQGSLNEFDAALRKLSNPNGVVQELGNGFQSLSNIIKDKLGIQDLSPSNLLKDKLDIHDLTPNKSEPQFGLDPNTINDLIKQNLQQTTPTTPDKSDLSGSLNNLINHFKNKETLLPETTIENTQVAVSDQTSLVPPQDSLSELKDQLAELNAGIKHVIANTSEIAYNSAGQLRATKGLSSNRLAVG